MPPQRIKKIFAFLPWLAFWSQGGSAIPDLSKLRVAVALESSACKRIEETFDVRVARTDQSRAKGLSGRSTPLSRSEGMLFVFEQPQRVGFWMKDTLVPLQLLYFDVRGRLADRLEMKVETDPANPRKVYNSTGEVSTALEVAPDALSGAENGRSILCVDTVPRP